MSEQNKKIEIVPAIIPEDFEHLSEQIAHVCNFVKTIQIDVTDGKFAPSTTWPYNSPNDENWQNILNQNNGLPGWDKVDFEIDLMVDDQLSAAKDWIAAGAVRLICHIESLSDENWMDFVKLKNEFNIELYASLIPSTPNSELEKYLPDVAGVQFMGNDKIGYHGVELDEKVYEKISDLRQKNPDLPISIDIGVNFETAPLLIKAGATKLASGGLIFNSPRPKEVIDELGGIS